MSHAPQGGQAPDQASSGRQTGAAVPPGQIIPKARNAAGHLTSHTQHGDTRLTSANDRHPRRVSQSPERLVENFQTERCRKQRAVFEYVAPGHPGTTQRLDTPEASQITSTKFDPLELYTSECRLP